MPTRAEVGWELNSVAIHLVRYARIADRELGVPPAQLSALSVLVFGGERTVAELAAAEQVTSPTMTQIVTRLDRAGLAERRDHPRDARATLVRATAKGRRVMERGRRRRVQLLDELLAALTGAELDAVSEAIGALRRALPPRHAP
jgi:DNA-binding MarR family transcriptional regulator